MHVVFILASACEYSPIQIARPVEIPRAIGHPGEGLECAGVFRG